MPLDMALRTIDEAAALGAEELQLSGGDRLLRVGVDELEGIGQAACLISS
jgi:MoaA/NifB/PqqE/SkfB family radical SAM enzyme